MGFPFFAVMVALSSLEQSSAQIIHGDFVNSKVSYLYVTESGPNVPPTLFAPPQPTTTADPESQLSFAPNDFIQTDQSLEFDLKTKSSHLQINMQAADGLWFDDMNGVKPLELYTAGSYSLVAPVPQSQAFASFTASYTLVINEVDNAPFGSGAPYSANVAIVPSGASIIGPNGSAAGTWNGSVQLDINTIKTHFGLAPTSKVTGMLLHYTANLSAAGVYGQSTATRLDFNVVNATVPEPSTYALLLMTGAGALWLARRRR
jgi:hypothetical protein